jgi:hypothetical protein
MDGGCVVLHSTAPRSIIFPTKLSLFIINPKLLRFCLLFLSTPPTWLLWICTLLTRICLLGFAGRLSGEVFVFRLVWWWFGADLVVLGRFGVVVVSFRWSGGGRRSWCCGGWLGGLAVMSFVGVVVVAGGLDVVVATDLRWSGGCCDGSEFEWWWWAGQI